MMTMLLASWLLAILVPSATNTARASNPGGMRVSNCPGGKEAILEAHNTLRARHGVPDLTWNEDLHPIANAWTEILRDLLSASVWEQGVVSDDVTVPLGLGTVYSMNWYGESFVDDGDGGHELEGLNRDVCLTGVQGWANQTWKYTSKPYTDNKASDWIHSLAYHNKYNQFKQYQFSNGTVLQSLPPTGDANPGQLTQMVWKSTTQIACGAVRTSGEDGELWLRLVCLYSPPANMPATDAAFLQNVLPPKSPEKPSPPPPSPRIFNNTPHHCLLNKDWDFEGAVTKVFPGVRTPFECCLLLSQHNSSFAWTWTKNTCTLKALDPSLFWKNAGGFARRQNVISGTKNLDQADEVSIISGCEDPGPALAAMNSLRARHGAANLTWSDDLVQTAKDLVQARKSGPLSPPVRGLVTWIIPAIDTSNLFCCGWDELRNWAAPKCKTGVDIWAKQPYKWVNTPYFANKAMASDFAQVVWKSSRSVGCATFAGNGVDSSSIVACLFSPPGNNPWNLAWMKMVGRPQ